MLKEAARKFVFVDLMVWVFYTILRVNTYNVKWQKLTLI
jgi:hypothetical protein